MNYDKGKNLAVCPYCGTTSTVYEQDRKLFEQFQTMFAALLEKGEEGAKAEEGFWIEAERRELTREDGGVLVAVKKQQGVYPLKLLGLLLDRHVAWIISRLENLCCLLSYNGMVLNGLTVDNLFVSPASHQIYLYGGWWFAGYENDRMNGISADVRKCIYRKYLEKKRCHHSTDLESLRFVAIKLLGCETREDVKEIPNLPAAFCDFLLEPAEESAAADFAYWDRTLEKSYGERKFIPLPVTEEELYSRIGKQTGKEQ